MSLKSIRSLTNSLKNSSIIIRNNSTSTTTATPTPSTPITDSNFIPTTSSNESSIPSTSASTLDPIIPTSASSSSSSSSSFPPSLKKIIKPKLKPSHLMTENPITLPLEKHYPIQPREGAIHVATLQLRSHTDSLERLTFFTSFALRAAKALNLPTSGMISLPTKISLYTTPRSPFAHKKSQENFWKKEHKRSIKVFDGHEEIVSAWLAYLRKEAMGGVGMKAQIISYKKLGWGEEMIKGEELRESALESNEVEEGSAKEVEMLAKEIVEEIRLEAQEAAKNSQGEEVKLPSKEAEVVTPGEKKVEGEGQTW